jgi:hypothetical protein
LQKEKVNDKEKFAFSAFSVTFTRLMPNPAVPQKAALERYLTPAGKIQYVIRI